ncbi:MAG: hypothetical protein ACM3PQ_00045 [Methanosarcina sp.]
MRHYIFGEFTMSDRTFYALLRLRRLDRLAAMMLAAAISINSGLAHAAGNACLLEGNFKFAGKTTEIKDCLQNAGVRQEELIDACKSIATMGAAFGAPPKVTYVNSCPAGFQAVCEGMWGHPLHSYYYKRDAKDLADAKSSCLAQGGKWRG